MKKAKAYWDMTTKELAEATRQFDDPSYDPPGRKLTKDEAKRLKAWRQKRKAERAIVPVALEPSLVEQIDEYAASRGLTFSQVVAEALQKLMRKRSA